MKFRMKNWRMAIVGIACVTVVATGSSMFIRSMNNMLKNNTLNTIEELAEHDLVSMEGYLDQNWDLLDGIEHRIVSYNCNTLLAAQERLNLECASTDFHSLWLMTDDGTIYNDRYMNYTADEMDMAQYIHGLEDRMVSCYDFATTTEAQREMILFAIPVKNLRLQDENITALIGLMKIQNIQDKMNIASFEKDGQSRGYSSVFDPEGAFIVNVEKNYTLNRRQNMFDVLNAGQAQDGWTTLAVQDAMARDESFDFSFTQANGNLMQLYFQPVPGTNWYFVSMVENSVFTDMTRSFVMTSFGMVGIVLSVTIVVFILLINGRKKTMLADASMNARNEFLSRMSHEIRTPLNGVLGLLHLIQTRIPKEQDEKLNRWLGQCSDSADYLEDIVTNILLMSRVTNRKVKMSNHSFLLEPMLDSVYSLAIGDTDPERVHLILETNLSEPCIVGDEIHLKQVLMSIVGNAVKYTPPGNPIWVRVNQNFVEEGRVETIFQVQDTGPGISREYLPKIWEPFEQGNDDENDRVWSGTGLGLSIAKGLADAMNASLEVETKTGVGSTFTLRLVSKVGSLRAVQEKMEKQNTIQILDTSYTMGARLMVVDDNDIEREMLMQVLQDKGFEIVGAKNGQEALDILNGSKPWEFDGILMDMRMPVMDGPAAAKAIRKANRTDVRTIPIFACSASDFTEDREKALRAGIDDFIPKPIHAEELLKKINMYHQFKYKSVNPSEFPKILKMQEDALVYGTTYQSMEAHPDTPNGTVRDLLRPEAEAEILSGKTREAFEA